MFLGNEWKLPKSACLLKTGGGAPRFSKGKFLNSKPEWQPQLPSLTVGLLTLLHGRTTTVDFHSFRNATRSFFIIRRAGSNSPFVLL